MRSGALSGGGDSWRRRSRRLFFLRSRPLRGRLPRAPRRPRVHSTRTGLGAHILRTGWPSAGSPPWQRSAATPSACVPVPVRQALLSAPVAPPRLQAGHDIRAAALTGEGCLRSAVCTRLPNPLARRRACRPHTNSRPHGPQAERWPHFLGRLGWLGRPLLVQLRQSLLAQQRSGLPWLSESEEVGFFFGSGFGSTLGLGTVLSSDSDWEAFFFSFFSFFLPSSSAASFFSLSFLSFPFSPRPWPRAWRGAAPDQTQLLSLLSLHHSLSLIYIYIYIYIFR